MTTYTRNCRRCGAEFSTVSPKKVHCSEKCRVLDAKARKKAEEAAAEDEAKEERPVETALPEDAETRKCKLCGREFVVTPWRLWFCCDAHQRHWMQGGARNMKTIRE